MYDDLPRRMQSLPRDKHHRPVPWFVSWIDGEPDFRVADGDKVRRALKHSLCWVCGWGFTPGEHRAFVIGPMCTVNRVSSEPPSHYDCAVWSARNCPFLTRPDMIRREKHIPEGTVDPAGHMITRNPGVAVVWITGYRGYAVQFEQPGKPLFRLGEPRQVLWYAEGRMATRAEVMASIESGLPALQELAEEEGPDATERLEHLYEDALAYVPGE